MADYDPDRKRFRKYDQEFSGPVGEVVLRGSVEAWQCSCYHWNGDTVPRCNNCGQPRPEQSKKGEVTK